VTYKIAILCEGSWVEFEHIYRPGKEVEFWYGFNMIHVMREDLVVVMNSKTTFKNNDPVQYHYLQTLNLPQPKFTTRQCPAC